MFEKMFRKLYLSAEKQKRKFQTNFFVTKEHCCFQKLFVSQFCVGYHRGFSENAQIILYEIYYRTINNDGVSMPMLNLPHGPLAPLESSPLCLRTWAGISRQISNFGSRLRLVLLSLLWIDNFWTSFCNMPGALSFPSKFDTGRQ